MTPMIDVTFLLLVFFIVTLNFRVLEGRLDTALPKASGVHHGSVEEIEKLDVRILVAEPGVLVRDPEAKDLHVYQGRRLRFETGSHRFATMVELRDFLVTWPDREVPVSIDPRDGTVYGDIIPVLDALIEQGFEDIAFVGTFEQNW